MVGCLKSDLRRAVTGIGLWVTMVCSCFSVLQPVWAESTWGSTDAVSLFELSGHMNMQAIALIGGAAAFSCSFVQDWDRRFCRFIMLRSGRIRYIVSRGLVCVLASYFAVMIGQWIALMALSTQTSFYVPSNASQLMAHSSGGNLLLQGRPYAYILLLIHSRSLHIAMWAYLALGVSTYVQNRFVVLFSPLLGFYGYAFFEGIWKDPSTPSLMAIVNGITALVNPIEAVMLVLSKCLPIFAVITVIYGYGIRRRLRCV